MAHIRRAIMEEHRASMEAYKKVHEETVRYRLRMDIVQKSMEMDMWEIKEKLAERREQIAIRAYEEDKRREEWIQKIEEDKRMAKIAVEEGITRLVFRVKGVDLGARTPYYARKDFLDCHLPREWEIARDVELNPFKDTLVFRRMVEFIGHTH
nr:hypothetical protein [Tanacetum cinerariifolium]